MLPVTPSSSGVSSNVKSLVRKYSSDSDASPEAKPPEKKFISNLGTIMSHTASHETGTPGASAAAPGQTPAPDPLDTGPPPKDLAEAMIQMKSMMTSMRNDIMNRISVSEDKMVKSVKDECKKMEDRIMLEIATVNNKITAVDAKVDALQLKFSGYDDRLKIVEDALAANGALVQDFDPEVTVIVTGVPYVDTEDVKVKCQEIIDHIRSSSTPVMDPIAVVNAIRTPFRNGRAGVIKLQLPSRQNKIDILKGKKSLSNNGNYSRAYIRGSQSHTERLIHLNTNTLLNELGIADKYRVAGNGRLVPKQYPDQQLNGPPRPYYDNQNAGYDQANLGPQNPWNGHQQHPFGHPGPMRPPGPFGPTPQRPPFNQQPNMNRNTRS